jgi:uncharacterized membrane protein YfcA
MSTPNVIAGLLVGLVVGMTGVGGGALMTPILVLMFGVAPAAAVGTDLWFAAFTKMAGGTLHHQRGAVDWRVLRLLCLGSLPASVSTLLLLHLLGGAERRNGHILQLLGVVLVLTALAMVFRRRAHEIGRSLRVNAADRFKRLQPMLTVLAGAVLGLLVTLTSVGAGALGAVMLVYLYPFRMTPTKLVGTDIVHAIPLTLVAGTGHLFLGNVDHHLLWQLLVGSIPGVLLGAALSHRTPDRILRLAIGGVLVIVGIKLFNG